MTVLENQIHTPFELFEPEDLVQLSAEILRSYDGHTLAERAVNAAQIEYFIENVQPRLKWAQHLGWMQLNHSNVILGEE
jgi:hypothetical protein